MDGNNGSQGPARYRIEIEGEIDPEWAAWFGARDLRTEGGRSVLEVTVADAAALQGALRRVHDLHLRLVSLVRVEQG